MAQNLRLQIPGVDLAPSPGTVAEGRQTDDRRGNGGRHDFQQFLSKLFHWLLSNHVQHRCLIIGINTFYKVTTISL
jgi:hypothetical protein